MTPHAEVVLATIAALRRRWRVVAFARAAVLSEAVALAAAVPLVAWLRPQRGAGLAAILLTAGVVSAAALAFVLARTPSSRHLAAAADRALALDDRLAAAVQHASDTDVVSLLLLRDAALRIQHVRAAIVYPLEWTRASRNVALCVLLAGAIATIVAMRLSPPPTSAATRAASAASGGAGVEDDAQAGGVGKTTDGAAARAGEAQLVQRPPAPGAGQRRSEAVTAQRPQSPAATETAEAGAHAGARGNATAAPQGRGAGAATRPLASGGMAAPGGAAITSKAGGVGRGDAAGGAPRGIRSGVSASEYAGARARAETAIAQERIPAGLRDYLKAYFIAIRP